MILSHAKTQSTSAIVLLVLIAVPLVWSLWGALTAGLDQAAWAALFSEPQTWRALRMSMWTGLVSTVLAVAGTAWVLSATVGSANTPRPAQRLARWLAPLLAVPHAAFAIGLVALLAPGGWLSMIFATECLPEALHACAQKLGSVAVLPLAARVGQPGLRVILQARKGGGRAFRLLAPFVLHGGDEHDIDRDSYTPVAKGILRDGRNLIAEFR